MKGSSHPCVAVSSSDPSSDIFQEFLVQHEMNKGSNARTRIRTGGRDTKILASKPVSVILMSMVKGRWQKRAARHVTTTEVAYWYD